MEPINKREKILSQDIDDQNYQELFFAKIKEEIST